MSFRKLDFQHLARFNSSISSEFLDMYEGFVDTKIVEESAKPSHRSFAPSSFRCDRRSWFRLRGVDPDVIKSPDPVLRFTADIGTACHRIIQSNLKNCLGDRWLNVRDYLLSDNYICEDSSDSLETLVEVKNPPVRFACDGLISWDGETVLLEIKSAEFSTWQDLTDPKDEHVDQVKFYCYLLNVHKALVLYIDRQYGGLKCYEVNLNQSDFQYIHDKIQNVLKCVDRNIAPDPLPKGDPWCNQNRCAYYKKCQEYGRW